jgi:hypothetical protein
LTPGLLRAKKKIGSLKDAGKAICSIAFQARDKYPSGKTLK